VKRGHVRIVPGHHTLQVHSCSVITASTRTAAAALVGHHLPARPGEVAPKARIDARKHGALACVCNVFGHLCARNHERAVRAAAVETRRKSTGRDNISASLVACPCCCFGTDLCTSLRIGIDLDRAPVRTGEQRGRTHGGVRGERGAPGNGLRAAVARAPPLDARGFLVRDEIVRRDGLEAQRARDGAKGALGERVCVGVAELGLARAGQIRDQEKRNHKNQKHVRDKKCEL
jgi:hypothetical protein